MCENTYTYIQYRIYSTVLKHTQYSTQSRVSRAGPMTFYWPRLTFCLMLFSLCLLSFCGLVLWGQGLRTDRSVPALHCQPSLILIIIYWVLTISRRTLIYRTKYEVRTVCARTRTQYTIYGVRTVCASIRIHAYIAPYMDSTLKVREHVHAQTVPYGTYMKSTLDICGNTYRRAYTVDPMAADNRGATIMQGINGWTGICILQSMAHSYSYSSSSYTRIHLHSLCIQYVSIQ